MTSGFETLTLLVALKMGNTKPYVQVACVCENVLMQDNVPSLIRIVDTFFLMKPEGLPPGGIGITTLKVFVSVKSGDVTGKHKLALVLNFPQGQKIKVAEADVTLLGDVHGHLLNYSVDVQVGQEGTHWFDVLWDGEELTRIPFKLQLAPESAKSPTN